ncbi:hypothetical protein [Haladaptatus sp. DYF46]|uniref:hypothetical protein n=1 Tax=Haladaptatus sp. DYF46 TaxID=2886041 RepID=UPI001E3A422A|nr:hypothetical protein [Haladaptatus sp. DYF46]
MVAVAENQTLKAPARSRPVCGISALPTPLTRILARTADHDERERTAPFNPARVQQPHRNSHTLPNRFLQSFHSLSHPSHDFTGPTRPMVGRVGLSARASRKTGMSATDQPPWRVRQQVRGQPSAANLRGYRARDD